jgi:hypothetical protein
MELIQDNAKIMDITEINKYLSNEINLIFCDNKE